MKYTHNHSGTRDTCGIIVTGRSTDSKNDFIVRFFAPRAGILEDQQVSEVVEKDISPKQFRQNWARLIQKVYNVDLLCCPKCSGKMCIIAFIEDKVLIKKILKHLNLWMTCNNSLPKKFATYDQTDWCQDYESQIEYKDNYSQNNMYDEL